jgi:hypothetical protein
VIGPRWLNLLTVIGLAGLLGLLALTAPRWALLLRSPEVDVNERTEGESPAPAPSRSPASVERQISVTLFFVSPERPGLAQEERLVAFSGDLATQVQVVVEELLRGSTTGLLSPLPPSTRVLDAFVRPGGVAYVNLDPGVAEPEAGEGASEQDDVEASPDSGDEGESETEAETSRALAIQGSSEELLAVYSLVNSIVINLPAVHRVQILLRGRLEQTLGGHIDISRPLAADATYLAIGPDLLEESPAPGPEAAEAQP